MYHIKVFYLWLKENWKLPLFILWTVVVWCLSKKNADAAIETLEVRKESFEKQLIKITG